MTALQENLAGIKLRCTNIRIANRGNQAVDELGQLVSYLATIIEAHDKRLANIPHSPDAADDRKL